MHHYPFHVGDYTSHTQHLDEIEDLAYRRMLDYMYLNEINLPESIDEVARLIRMRTHCERIAVVLKEFFSLENGEWINKRAIQEIAKYHSKSDKAKESASKRWKKDDANALRTHNERNANQNQNQNQEPVKEIVLASAQTRAQKGTRLSIDWQLPKELGNWALDQGLSRDSIIYEASKFRDHWVSQSGSKGVKSDWPATWRNWIRRSTEGSGSQKTHAERTQEYKDKKAEEFYAPLLDMTEEERKAWGL